VVALVTEKTRDLVLPMAFGDRKSSQSLAATLALQRTAATHGFTADSIGYIDLVGFARAFVGDSSELANEISKRLGIVVSEKACITEIPGLADPVPRIAFGTYSMDERRASVGIVVEMRKDIARAFAGMRSSVPGLDPRSTRGAKMSFGVGIDVGALLPFLSEKLRAIVAKPYRCSHLTSLNEGADDAARSLSGLVGKPLSTIRGINVILHELKLVGGVPSSIKAIGFLGTDDPAQLLAIIRMYAGPSIPELKPGAAPVRVPIPGLGAGMLGDVFIASAPTGLGVSIGYPDGGPLVTILGASPAKEQPLLYSRIDPTFAGQMAALQDDEYGEIAAMSPKLAKALRDIDRAQYSHMESMTFSAETTERGIVTRIDIGYRPR
jgi:hypothetical protein